MNHLLFIIVGLGAGAAFAAVAMALVTTFRGTGVVNIAQGAMAMWPAYVYDEVRRSGDVVLPVGRITLGGPTGPWAALAIGLMTAALVGLVSYGLVFRPLRSAPPLARVVASVGVTIVFQAGVALRFGVDQRAVPHLLPHDNVTVGSLSFSADRIWLTVLVLGLTTVLWAYGRFTRLGLATRGAAEDERAAIVLGYSPDRLAAVTWVLASVVGGSVAIVVSPTLGLDPVRWTLIVVPALACALLGRLTSVGVACGAGLALGAFQSEITLLQTMDAWPDWATVGVAQSVPLVVIVFALVALGRRFPARGTFATARLPGVVVPRHRPGVVAVLVGAGVASVLLTSGSYRFGVITSMIFAILALSLVVLTGFVGQISLAQAAFAGTAGFTLSKLGTTIPFPLSLLLAATAAAMLGVLIGLPALRIRGAQLAVVTLAAGVAIENLVFRNPNFVPTSGNRVPDARLFGVDLAVRRGTELARWQFGLFILAVLVLAAVAVANAVRSSTGRSLLAVRSNERAAASIGVNVATTKLLAFFFSSFLAGLAGALIAYSRGQLSADSFTVSASLSLLAFAYLGGITSIGGALVAGLLAPLGIGYVVMDRVFALNEYYLLVSGALLLVTAITSPAGVAGRIRELRPRRGVTAIVSPEPPAAPPAAELDPATCGTAPVPAAQG